MLGEVFDVINFGNLYFMFGKYDLGIKYLERFFMISRVVEDK